MNNKLTARAVSKIRRDWIAGVSLSDLAAEHDVTDAAIHYHVRGLAREAMPPKGRPPSFDHKKALKLFDYGLSMAEIARRFGVSRVHIRRILLDAGISTKRRAAA